jgi:glycosyltransferase involved in cell wall biosynthesis
LQPYDLEPGRYNLLIARLEPENNIETILDAHLPDHIRTPVMVIGNTATQYGRYLTAKYEDEKRIRFLGSIYDKTSLDSIRHFARLYFHGHSVGGTNPSLLEAMACGCPIMAHDNRFNRGVLLDAAVFFSNAAGLSQSIADSEAGRDNGFFSGATVQNITRIRTVFSEEHIFSAIMQQLSQWVQDRRNGVKAVPR